jgi:acetyl-CoA carboxylase carboxyl transferase subunit beta
VTQARSLERLKCVDYLRLAFTDFLELHGDRVSGDCPATVGGPAWLGTQPVMVIGQQKGHDPAELMRHNFGMPVPAGYRKAARLMRLAEKLRLPVVTLVDTPGAYPGADAEENGQAVAIAENLRLMMSLTIAVGRWASPSPTAC